MPLDTFTYYLLKVGFIPPLRAHSVPGKEGWARHQYGAGVRDGGWKGIRIYDEPERRG